MDELRMIADLLDERPTEAAADAGRRRLRAEIAAPAGTAPARTAPARTGPSWFGTGLKVGLGVVAAGAAAAVAVAAVAPGTPAPPEPVRTELGERAVLAAAEQAAAQPSGAYWFSHQVHGQSYIMRPKTGSYAIVGAHSEFFKWAGAKPRTGEAFYGRDIPARPLTPRDEELWREAGSPSKFRVWSNDHYYTYGQGTTKWLADRPHAAGGGEFFISGSGRALTTEQIQKLPSDPKRLAELFLDPVRDPVSRKREMLEKHGVKDTGEHPSRLDACGSAATSASRAKVLRAGTLLMDAPLPPKVRSGLMRALAGQPGVESVGATTDALGREGVALASGSYTTCRDGDHGRPAQEQGRYRSREVLVFDRKTGRPLASQQVLTRPGGPYKDREPGFVINYRAVRDLGWADAKPEPPAELPF